MGKLVNKIVIFSSSNKAVEITRPQHRTESETKSFSVSSIKQRLIEDKKGIRVKFRNLIRDYRKVVQSAKESEVSEIRNLFNKDLVLLLSEAVERAEKGQTLNQTLGLTQLIPSARKLSNQLNILVRKIGKFYNQNGYMNKQMQTQFNDLFTQLITAINDAVYKNEINEEELNNEDVVEPKKFSAKRITFTASKNDIDSLMDKVDMDDVDVDETSVTVPEEQSNQVANMIAFSSMKYRIKMFSSEYVPVTFVVNAVPNESYADILSDVLNLMNNRGFIGTYDPNYNFDVIPLKDNTIQYIVYMDPTKILLNDASASQGIYIGKELPTDYKLLYESANTSNSKITTAYNNIVADSENKEMIQDIIKELDDVELELLSIKLLDSFDKAKIDSILS